MNIDEFLDDADGYGADESGTSTKNSLKMHEEDENLPAQSSLRQKENIQASHTDEIDFLNESVTLSWDEQVNNLVSQINQSVAEDDYEFAIQKYLELKELPSKIIEADLKTQARLKTELQEAHQKLTTHMQEMEAKHSEQTGQLKSLIQLALEELHSGNEQVSSDLYLKACQIYNGLPSEFQARNVKLHYDLLKLYFAIKETHDREEESKQSQFVQTFMDKYNEAIAQVGRNVEQAKLLHDDLHDKVLELPNEEIKLKSELLEKLNVLKNQISLVLSKREALPTQHIHAQVAQVAQQTNATGSQHAPLAMPNAFEPSQGIQKPNAIPTFQSQSNRAEQAANLAKEFSQAQSFQNQSQADSNDLLTGNVVKQRTFEKKQTPLVEKKPLPQNPQVFEQNPSQQANQQVVQQAASAQRQSQYAGVETEEDHEAIAKLRVMPKRGVEEKSSFGPKPTVAAVADPAKERPPKQNDEHLLELQDRAKRIRERLNQLHGKLESS